MSVRRVCVAVLAVQAWSAVWARPSEGLEATAGLPRDASLMDKNTFLNTCPHRPDTLSTPQEMTGDWCDMVYFERTENGTRPPRTCERVTIRPAGDGLQVILNRLTDGELVKTVNVTFSRNSNESWQIKNGNMTSNFFIGLSTDRKYLHICGTTSSSDADTEMYYTRLALCVQPGEEATGDKPRVIRCDLP